MKKFLKGLVTFVMIAVMSVPSVACNNNDDIEPIDPNRTQLYVFNFNGGFGVEWLKKLKYDYEELHKDDVWEEGKKGVQVYLNSQKEWGATADSIRYGQDEIYYMEAINYHSLINDDALLDISEVVKADLGEYGDEAGRTIESKLTARQKAYYGIDDGEGNKSYYIIPHYEGFYGLTYNIDLFEQYGYYLAKEPTGEEGNRDIIDYFVDKEYNPQKSLGLDGVPNTSDDGLPTTYDEFFLLCDYVASNRHTPIVWMGQDYRSYVNSFTKALLVDFEGADQFMLNYDFSGTATDLGTVDKDGNFVYDTEDTPIDTTNGYQLARQAGKYYVLEFLNRIINTMVNSTSTTPKYTHSLVYNGGFSHMDAQEYFLYAGHDGGETAPIAMLMDGNWWAEEASSTFQDMTATMGEEFSRENRRFGFMPFPKSEHATEKEKTTLIGQSIAVVGVKKNIAEWKKPLALDFLKFAHTDERLVEFTTITNTPKSLNYEIDDDVLNSLSPFGKSLFEMYARADVISPFSSNPFYINNTKVADILSSTIDNTTKTHPVYEFKEKKATPEEYFKGLYTYKSNYWTTL